MRYIIMRIFSISAILLLLSFSQKPALSEVIDRIVAQVGEKAVTLHDIEIYAPSIVKNINAIQNPEERNAAWNKYYEDTLTLMIETTTLEIAAARVGVMTNQAMIDDAIVRVQEQNTVFRDNVRKIINREGTVTPEVRLYIKNLILQSEVIKTLAPRAVVTEQDIRNTLKDDPNVKFGDTQYNIVLVFLPDNATYDNFTRAIARGTFETAAASVQQEIVPMGWTNSHQLIPEMANVVEKMAVGDVSPPFVDDDGRHVVLKLVDTKSDSNIPDALREQITNKLRDEQMQSVYENWLERNKRSILVTRFDN